MEESPREKRGLEGAGSGFMSESLCSLDTGTGIGMAYKCSGGSWMISEARFFFDFMPKRMTEDMLNRDLVGGGLDIEGTLDRDGRIDESVSAEGCLLSEWVFLHWAGESGGEYTAAMGGQGCEEPWSEKDGRKERPT